MKRGNREEEKRAGEESGEEGGVQQGEGGDGIMKIAFSNVAGLSNKDREFWKGINDVVVMLETWVEEKR